MRWIKNALLFLLCTTAQWRADQMRDEWAAKAEAARKARERAGL